VQSLFPQDTTVLALRIEHGAPPKLAAVGGMTVLTVGALEDLPAMMKRVGS
jgi:hypothetical protein